MSATKPTVVGRPRLAPGRKKVTYAFTIDPSTLSAIRIRAKHGNISSWIRNVIREALAK
jgi:hypothetical protein